MERSEILNPTISETLHVMIKDVDFDRNLIHVRQGKGRKDRYVPIAVD